jgi:hypothetical protein
VTIGQKNVGLPLCSALYALLIDVSPKRFHKLFPLVAALAKKGLLCRVVEFRVADNELAFSLVPIYGQEERPIPGGLPEKYVAFRDLYYAAIFI